MSCEDCRTAQNEGMVAPYRFGNANIDVLGCRVHVKEMFDVLNAHQQMPMSVDEDPGGGGVDTKYGNLHIQGVPQNEPVFVLRAQDAHAVYLLQEYQALAGSHNKHMEEAMELVIARFKAWQPKKLPD